MQRRAGSAPQWPEARWQGGHEPWQPDFDERSEGGRTRKDPQRRRRLRRWAGRRHDRGPLRRAQEGRLVGGVAAGLAARTGIDVTIVRVLFVALSLSGTSVAAYVVLWLLIPKFGQNSNIASRALTDRRGIALAAGLASLLAVLLLIAPLLGIGWLSTVAWQLVVSVAGTVLIWRNADPDEQATMRHVVEPVLGLTGGRKRSWTVLRVSIAILLLASGLTTLLQGQHRAASLRPLGGLALVVAAIVAVFGPWWLRIARDLVVERRARIRAEERADMAARVHDSVLQTLALIQLRASQPQQVIQLARAQERELRSWLFDGRAPGTMDGQGMTVAAGVLLIQQEVEAQHGVAVEAVTVGDCVLDDDLNALLAAGREATVNAVKWSGAPVVSLFAEVEPAAVSLFVRDRGRGFDPAAVPSDRKGLAESIRARMARRGGTATVRSVPGQGTEVALTMPRAVGERQPSRA